MLQSSKIKQEEGSQPPPDHPPTTYHNCGPTPTTITSSPLKPPTRKTSAKLPSSLTPPATVLPSSLSDLSSSSNNQPTVNNTPRSHQVDSISVCVDLEDQNPQITSSDFILQQSILKEQHLNDIKNQCSVLIHELDCNVDPEAVIKRHISQLEKYNELKDIALGLVTMIADQRQLRTTDILEEMKLELKDD